MLGHDFTDMPGQLQDLVLRCKWCMKTPTKAREDGCPTHELEETGKILLSIFNPEGVAYFHGRVCVTCDGPIMGHYLRRGSPHYWCFDDKPTVCEGINNCVFDVKGVKVPEEPTNVRVNDVPLVQEGDNQTNA